MFEDDVISEKKSLSKEDFHEEKKRDGEAKGGKASWKDFPRLSWVSSISSARSQRFHDVVKDVGFILILT